MVILDYLVVGSGCSGAMAAQTLVEAGKSVTMLDVGLLPEETTKIPDKDFLSIRKTEAEQYTYLIGRKASGVSWGKVGKGEQITPPRKHIIHKTSEYIPITSDSFSSLESLGYGGLGIGWGLQCWEYSPTDLSKVGLDTDSMSRAYQVVGNRIGISATKDDAARYTIGSLKSYQPSPRMDRNHTLIYKKYLRHKASLNKKGFFMGRTPLALITRDMNNRKGYSYKDMDFYSDNDQSAWRPWITVNQLRKKKNFNYIGGYLVLSFVEKNDLVEVTCLSVSDNTTKTFTCRKLILATSALGSGRIALRSHKKRSAKLPLLCNPYTYVTSVQPRFMGHQGERKKLGFTQLSLFIDEARDNTGVSVASLYGYQSLMLFRIIRHVPLNMADARIFMRYLITGIVITGIHHPDKPSKEKYIELVSSPSSPTGDALHISYKQTAAEEEENKRRESKLIHAMRKMGLVDLKRVNPGSGSSIHYAGTLPFSDKETPLTLSSSGRLHATKHVYVADSSGFRYLPAPGLTFTIMANAHLVAENVLKDD